MPVTSVEKPKLAGGILFVDDEPRSRKYFGRIFGKGRLILTAEDGIEALEVYEARASEIGIVVTDHLMPRLTGLELLRILREGGSPVVRILSTAYADSDLVQEAMRDGLIDHFMGKPWDLEKFERVLKQAGGNHSQGMGDGSKQGRVA